jgi:class 3 adenylate cyclase
MLRALLSVDIEGSGRPDRTSETSVVLRQTLFSELERAFQASGIDWSRCRREDTGDGMVVLVPPEFPEHSLVHPLLGLLADGLRHHNRGSGDVNRIRVRAALHSGEVVADDYGVTGRPQVHLARLLSAQPLREALARAPETATVAVLVSDHFYENVIVKGHRGIDPNVYSPVTVQEKETEARAWLNVVGHTGEFRTPAEKKPETRPSGGVHFGGSSQVEVHGDVFGGDKHSR